MAVSAQTHKHISMMDLVKVSNIRANEANNFKKLGLHICMRTDLLHSLEDCIQVD